MTNTYDLGLLRTTSSTGIRSGSARNLSTSRSSVVDGTGAAFVVTGGKTYYITELSVASAEYRYSGTITVMYDDDGAGTNEVTVIVIGICSASNYTFPVYIPIPAGKYLTAKGGSAAMAAGIRVLGREV